MCQLGSQFSTSPIKSLSLIDVLLLSHFFCCWKHRGVPRSHCKRQLCRPGWQVGSSAGHWWRRSKSQLMGCRKSIMHHGKNNYSVYYTRLFWYPIGRRIFIVTIGVVNVPLSTGAFSLGRNYELWHING